MLQRCKNESNGAHGKPFRALAIFAVIITLTTLVRPATAQAHPSCQNAEAVEEWGDARSDAAAALVDKGDHRQAMRFYADDGNAMLDCASEIIEYHAGNDARLRGTWRKTQYLLAASAFDSAAGEAKEIHDRARCVSYRKQQAIAMNELAEAARSRVDARDLTRRC